MIWWVRGRGFEALSPCSHFPSVKSSTCDLRLNFSKAQKTALIKLLPACTSCLYTSGDEWTATEYFYQVKLNDGSYPEGYARIRLAEKPHLAKGYFSSDFTWWNLISDLLFKFTYSSSLQVSAVIGNWNSHRTVWLKGINITSRWLSQRDEWEGNHHGKPEIKSQCLIN